MIQIYNEDCLEGMKKIPDGSVDMVLTDPPYGTTDCAFDKQVDVDALWTELNRVTKLNAAILLFSQLPFAVDLINANRKMFRYEWIWHKSLGTGFLNAKKMPLRCHENILVFYRKLPTYNPQFTKGKPYHSGGLKSVTHSCYGRLEGKPPLKSEEGKRYPRDVIYFYSTVGQISERLHPTQKPTDLLEYLIRTYTNEGETVLDATMGSGSTGVACVNTGRRFIGFELDEHYFDIANERIKKAQSGVESKDFVED